MKQGGANSESGEPENGAFATTHWSLVSAARKKDSPDSARALNELCRLYWYPLYCYARRRGCDAADAEDLVQSFFLRLLENDSFGRADPSKGRLRAFLLHGLKCHIVEWRRRAAAVKRGGGMTLISIDAEDAESRYANEPADIDSPDKLYDRRWAMTLIQRAVDAVGEPLRKKGKGQLFAKLSPYLLSDVELEASRRRQLATEFGMNESALKVTLHRLKKQQAAMLLEEVGKTVESEAEATAELEELLNAIV